MTNTRTFHKTHPWINFQLDLRQVDYTMWLQLGEAQAKCEQVKGSPLLPEVEQSLYQMFLAKGALATTAIEGNTLSEPEALQLLKGELKLPPSQEYLGQEIDNVIEACILIEERVLNAASAKLSVDTIKELNALILKDLPRNEDVYPGQIREHQVNVGYYRGAPPQDCEYLLTALCRWLNSFSAAVGIANAKRKYRVAFGILKAILAHVYLAWIHPFGDGNGRTARLVEFQILLSSGAPSTAAHLLSNFYNRTRTEYYRQLHIASQSGIVPFIKYALQGFVDELNEQLQMIEEQQLDVHWTNYVHRRFRDRNSPTDIRRRQLVLDLTAKVEPVPLAQLRYISPRIAEAYAGKTDKTVQRDVNRLAEMDLVKYSNKGVQGRRERMSAFRPATING